MSAPVVLPDPGGFSSAVSCVESGGVLAFPTETVYGIGVDPFNDDAIQRVFDIKGRDVASALPILVSSPEQLSRVVSGVTPNGLKLMERFWPGPLTLVLPAHPELPSALTGGLPTIAVRQSSSATAAALVDHLEGPLTATSANRSGQPPCTSAHEVEDALGNGIDLILDGGPTTTLTPSTLVDVTGPVIEVLRPGPLSESAILAALY